MTGYEIVQELGRGRHGVVYEARDLRLKRLVALKVLLTGAHAGPTEKSRFQTEAEAVARLQHPNIVQIFDVGEDDGQPFLSLEYVDGGNLAQEIDGTPQPVSFAAELVEALARAVHYAHEREVLHRDLKPSNILLTADGLPKITDLSIAKLLDCDDQRTQTGAFLGTPEYMSPEQASGRTKELGPTTDVYGLGAILYEMLTGRPPFKGTTRDATLEFVRSQEPIAPRLLQPDLPRDLDTICLKCLMKNPADRYRSALALAEDLRRFQQGMPILARPESGLVRLWKRAKRHPGRALQVALFGLLAVLTPVTLLWLQQQRTATIDAEVRASKDRYLAAIGFALREWSSGHVREAQRILDDCPEHLREWEWCHLRQRCQGELRDLAGHTGPVYALAYNHDASLLASASQDSSIRLWDTSSGKTLRVLQDHQAPIRSIAFSPDGARLASASDDKTVRLWDVATGQCIRTINGHDRPLRSVSFFSGNQRILAADNQSLRIWDAHSGAQTFVVDNLGMPINAVTCSPDQRLIAAALGNKRNGAIRVWNAETGSLMHQFDGFERGFSALAFGPNSRQLAAGSLILDFRVDDGAPVRVWDLVTGKIRFELRGHTSDITAVTFASSDERLVSSSKDSTLRVWDLKTGVARFVFRDTDHVDCLAVTPAGDRIASGNAHEKKVKIWDATAPQGATRVGVSSRLVNSFAFSPDDTVIAVAAGNQEISLWDRATAKVIGTWRHEGPWRGVLDVSWRPDGRRIASASRGEHVKVWDVPTAQEALSLDHEGASCVAFSPDGRQLATGGTDKTARLWDASTGIELLAMTGHAKEIRGLAFSHDGRRLATASADFTVRVWKLETGETDLLLEGTREFNDVAFSPDDAQLAAANDDKIVRIWDAASGALTDSLRGHTQKVTSVSFHPDGNRLASSSIDKTAKIWDLESRREVLTLSPSSGGITKAAFSTDGNLLATAGWKGAILIWSGAPLDD